MTEHPSEPQLRALVRVSSAVAGAHRLEEVLQLVAEQALATLPAAASVTINRWEADEDRLRTLVNVGQLGPREERWPREALWPLSDLPFDRVLLERQQPYVLVADQHGLPERNAALLADLRKESHLAVPIVVDGRSWGSLEAFSPPAGEPFAEADMTFLSALAAQASAAIARADLFSRLNSLAYEDPLTALPNRRALDERLEEAVTRASQNGTALSLIFCDLDGLKEINDELGHDAGDRALVTAAGALAAAVAQHDGGFVARLGGDEFCVLLEGVDADGARALAVDASRRLAVADRNAMTFSCGVASIDDGHARSADLLRAADAAQYAAKRLGRNRVFVAQSGASTVLGAPVTERPSRRGRRRLRDTEPHAAALVRSVLRTFENELADAGSARRLAGLAIGASEAFDLGGWSVSTASPGTEVLYTVFEGGRRTHRVTGAPSLAFAGDQSFSLAEYPLTAAALRHGGWFAVDVDDHAADLQERRLLTELSYTGVVAVAVRDETAAHLLELYTDKRSGAVGVALPEIRLLALAAVAGTAGERQPASGSPLDSFGAS